MSDAGANPHGPRSGKPLAKVLGSGSKPADKPEPLSPPLPKPGSVSEKMLEAHAPSGVESRHSGPGWSDRSGLVLPD